MDFPKFYDPTKVGTLFTPDMHKIYAEGAAARLSYRIPPAARDQVKIVLIIVDGQVDFIHTNGALPVPGAIEDTRRNSEWIFRNLERITSIRASEDKHLPFQIFHPPWWVNARGEHPGPFTPISLDDYHRGIWRPVIRIPYIYIDPATGSKKEIDWHEYYLSELETRAKKTLMIWPLHCLEGHVGSCIEPSLYQAIAYHTAVRMSQPTWIPKGTIPRTEHYSILEPEVKVSDHPQGGTNIEFLETLANYDYFYVAGQAKSHCVLETLNSIHRYFKGKAPEILQRGRILIDCMSSVYHPDVNFEAMANARFADFVADGLKLVRSTDPID